MSDTWVRSSAALRYRDALPISNLNQIEWSSGRFLPLTTAFSYSKIKWLEINYGARLDRIFEGVDCLTLIELREATRLIDSISETAWGQLRRIEVRSKGGWGGQFIQLNSGWLTEWRGLEQVDVNAQLPFSRVNVVGGLSTTDVGLSMSFVNTPTPQDVNRSINWGYGLDNFLVGGVSVPSTPAPDAIEPPDGTIIEHINYEVFIAVNSVIITVEPGGQNIEFENFTISRDIESFAWTASFDVPTKEHFDLIRPQGKIIKTVLVDINGQQFRLFVSRGRRQISHGKSVYQCVAWSNTKLLADPYSTKKDFTDTAQRTAAQIVDQELTGTGFTYTWSTVDWLIPQGVHSYQNKTTLGAIIDLAASVGAVVVPSPDQDRIDIQPYYPVSPWQWSSQTPSRTMDERQFFEIGSETVPKENPDGVYVYGEENSGVGLKTVRNGKPGNNLLGDIVNKYVTENTAAQERGRVEICRNSFIEVLTMATYVDENNIIMPQELIRFTDLENNQWDGMVLSVRVTCQQVGRALTQSITVARFYDD